MRLLTTRELYYLFLLKPCRFNKHEIIKPPYNNENRMYLITKGFSGHFVYKDGHNICIDLNYEGDSTGDYYSLLLQTNPMKGKIQNSPVKYQISLTSSIYVMALEPIEAMALAKDDLFTLYHQPDHGQRIDRMNAGVLYMHKQAQQIELLTLTAEEEYLRLIYKQPNILLLTANKHIASYLGIARESSSSIRKKISGNPISYHISSIFAISFQRFVSFIYLIHNDMKIRKENTNMKRFIAYLIVLTIIILAQSESIYTEKHVENTESNLKVEQSIKFIISTSVLGLLVLAYPDENTFYFQLDFGHTMKNNDNVVLGFMMYQYRRPHSTLFNDVSTYTGFVLSYGPVFAYQQFF
ncbi:MAG: hypothetical protein ACOCXH_12315 [Cyclobacteriaceae bacterium]